MFAGARCIVLDVSLPGMSGIELCERIRGTPGGADMPVIIMTAHDRRHVREAAEELGVIAYLVKPFSGARRLAHFVHAHLRRGAGHRALRAGLPPRAAYVRVPCAKVCMTRTMGHSFRRKRTMIASRNSSAEFLGGRSGWCFGGCAGARCSPRHFRRLGIGFTGVSLAFGLETRARPPPTAARPCRVVARPARASCRCRSSSPSRRSATAAARRCSGSASRSASGARAGRRPCHPAGHLRRRARRDRERHHGRRRRRHGDLRAGALALARRHRAAGRQPRLLRRRRPAADPIERSATTCKGWATFQQRMQRRLGESDNFLGVRWIYIDLDASFDLARRRRAV